MEGAGRRCAINFLSQMRGFFNHGYARHTSGDTKLAAVSTVPFGTVIYKTLCTAVQKLIISKSLSVQHWKMLLEKCIIIIIKISYVKPVLPKTE
ncbi:hypothetical protein T02_11331 [Trichinella nativa]|uniref:Uncharacterized protein n=1 Tax=Trichinella nativa TaxID=6335 RepID=A0A0V1KYE5_9BILA|nr:hypothetical protein T02_11331 [Trichinella nativa]